MADDYTPSVDEAQSYYVAGRAQIRRQVTGERTVDTTPYSHEFDRMLTAQVKAVRSEKHVALANVTAYLRAQLTGDPSQWEHDAAELAKTALRLARGGD